MGFGGRSRIHTSKILRLSEDMPMIIEIVDEEEKIGKFLPILHDIFEEADCGGLITMEKAEIIKYVVHKKKCIKREIVSKEFNLCLTKDIYVNNFDSVKGDLHEIYINRDNTHSIFNSNLFCTTSLANNGPRRMVLPESISSRAKNS